MRAYVYMTQDGLDTMRAELSDRINTIRPQLSRQIADARALGDLSENAEYHAIRNEARKNETRIEEIEGILKSVKVIAKKAHDMVELSARISLIKNTDTEIVYTLVSAAEANIQAGKLSIESPIGQMLLGKTVGDECVHRTPGGDIHYRITGIE